MTSCPTQATWAFSSSSLTSRFSKPFFRFSHAVSLAAREAPYRRWLPAGRTDYLPCRPLTEGTEPIPLAISESKREDLPPEHGLQQGKDYQSGKLLAPSNTRYEFINLARPRTQP